MRPHRLVPGLVLAAIVLGCRGGTDDWIAEVDRKRISASELRTSLKTRLKEQPDAAREEILNEELDRLITERVVLNRASKLGVQVSDSEVEDRLHRLHSDALVEIDETYREEVRRQMIFNRTALIDLADQIRVPESTLVLYFEENRERYRTPARVQIRQIVVEDEKKAQHLLKELRGGAEFSGLAAEHSLAPEAGEGGLLPPFARGDMPLVFERAFDLKFRQFSEVIASPYGFHIFQLDRKIPATKPDLAEIRDEVLFEVQQERLSRLKREWLRSLRRSADIRLNEAALEKLR